MHGGYVRTADPSDATPSPATSEWIPNQSERQERGTHFRPEPPLVPWGEAENIRPAISTRTRQLTSQATEKSGLRWHARIFGHLARPAARPITQCDRFWTCRFRHALWPLWRTISHSVWVPPRPKPVGCSRRSIAESKNQPPLISDEGHPLMLTVPSRHSLPRSSRRLRRHPSLLALAAVVNFALIGGTLVAVLGAQAAPTVPTVATMVITPQGQASSTLVSAPVRTTSAQLLVAFLASDSKSPGASFDSVTGCSLSWHRAARANGQAGPVEIWSAQASAVLSGCRVRAHRAFGSWQGLITVAGYTGARGIGATSAANGTGEASVSLKTTAANSLVYAVGSDWDNAVAREPAGGTKLEAQFLAPAKDTYWVQSAGSVIASTKTVTLADSRATGDRFNMAAVEILGATGDTVTKPSQSTSAPTAQPTTSPTQKPSPTAKPSTGTPTPTVTASSTPTATRTSAPGGSGDPTVPVGAFPNASRTGPTAAGYTLTAYTGPTNITTPGTVISGKRITGGLDISAANVTVQGCDITGTVTVHGVENAQILDSSIHGSSATDTSLDYGVHFAGSQHTGAVRRTNIQWIYGDYIQFGSGQFQFTDNYLHDWVTSRGGSSAPHYDGISGWDGDNSGLLIDHNTVLGPATDGETSAVWPGKSSNSTVTNNLLAGGGYIFYPPGPGTSGNVFSGNHISTRYHPDGGGWGVVYPTFNVVWGSNGNVWSGNVWDDGAKAGQAVQPSD